MAASPRVNDMFGIFGMRVSRKKATFSRVKPGVRAIAGKRLNVDGWPLLIGRDDMARGAPLARKTLPVGRVGGSSRNREAETQAVVAMGATTQANLRRMILGLREPPPITNPQQA